MKNLLRPKARFVNSISFLFLTYLAVFVASISITQDDYSTLSDLSLNGFFGPVSGVWNGLGGNISSVLPRALALSVGSYPNFPIGLIIFAGVTFFLILISFNYLLCDLIPSFKNLARSRRLLLLLVLSLGFEGLFTPGQVGVFGFSAAAGVHVWPICLVIIGRELILRNKPLSIFGALLAFLYASNSNIPEGVVALTVILLMNYQSNALRHRSKRSGPTVAYQLISAISALGLVVIFVAPGFEARTETAGVSFNPIDLLFGVTRAFVFFSADIFSHPFIYLAICLGFQVGKSRQIMIEKKVLKNLGAVTLLYFLLLVVGAGVAYPAWHQTFGLFVLLLPMSFAFGVYFSSNLGRISTLIRLSFLPVLLVCLLVTARSGYSTIDRKISWTSNFEHNVCVVQGINSDPLLGSEITYPPMNLGIEDLDTWPWMLDGFTNWIGESGISCKSPAE